MRKQVLASVIGILLVLSVFSVLTWQIKPVQATTVNYTVATNADDGLENYQNHGITQNYKVTVACGGDWASSDGLFRFQGVAVPQGSTINDAALSPYVNDVANDDLTCTIYGDDVDNSNNLTAEADIDGRTRTTASVSESHTALGTGFHDSNVTAIVQEIVNRGGWLSGNNMSFMYIATHPSGSANCEFEAYELAAHPAELEIIYSAGGGGGGSGADLIAGLGSADYFIVKPNATIYGLDSVGDTVTSNTNAVTVINTIYGTMTANQKVTYNGSFTIGATTNFAVANGTMNCTQGTFTVTGGSWAIYINVNATILRGSWIGSVDEQYILFGSNSAYSTINGTDFDNFGVYFAYGGSNMHNVTIANCVFHDRQKGSNALCIGGAGAGYNKFLNDTFEDNTGIIIFLDYTQTHNLISNCTFSNQTYSHSIYLNAGDVGFPAAGGYNNITNCVFKNMNDALRTSGAVQVKCPFNRIYNNTFQDYTGESVALSIYSQYVGATANDNEIYDNIFRNITDGFWLGHADYTYENTMRNKIYNNTFDDVNRCVWLNPFAGTITSVNDTQIYNNTFASSCSSIFPPSGSSVTLINGTQIYDNNFNGFSVEYYPQNWTNTLIYNNTDMGAYKMLNTTSVGAGYTSPSGIGWQYVTGTVVSVSWTPNSGNTRQDFSIDNVNQTTTTSPISVTMSAHRNVTAYFSGSPPPIVLTVTSPTNTTYPYSIVSVSLSATGGTVDKIVWNCTYTNSTVVYSNQTYTVATSMTLLTGSYIFHAVANNTDGNIDALTVWFSVSLSGGSNQLIVNVWWSGYW